MSVLARLKKQQVASKKLFAVVAGPRLAGKSSLAGTLPGKTLMLQAAVLESGSESAKALAERNGYELDVVNFSTADELMEVLKEMKTDDEYDNVFVDGLSALSELRLREPKLATLLKNDNWAAFRQLGESLTEAILALKELTYAEKAKSPKNVFLTCALKIKQDKSGAIVDVELECKGNVGVTSVTKFGEAVVTVLPPIATEDGTTGHRLITKSQDVWPGRIDGLLSDQNPGELPADLSQVIKLREGA
jgi:hypothetical protein